MFGAPYPTLRQPRLRRHGDDPSWALLAVALAIPLSVGIFGIPRLYAFDGISVPSLTATRPLAGAQPNISRPVVVPDSAPTLAPNPTAPTTPTAPTATPVQSTTQTYVVQRGDELRRIAAEHRVSISSLLAINQIPDPDRLRIGQVLQIPDSP
jgi:LysM repeat protein